MWSFIPENSPLLPALKFAVTMCVRGDREGGLASTMENKNLKKKKEKENTTSTFLDRSVSVSPIYAVNRL